MGIDVAEDERRRAAGGARVAWVVYLAVPPPPACTPPWGKAPVSLTVLVLLAETLSVCDRVPRPFVPLGRLPDCSSTDFSPELPFDSPEFRLESSEPSFSSVSCGLGGSSGSGAGVGGAT